MQKARPTKPALPQRKLLKFKAHPQDVTKGPPFWAGFFCSFRSARLYLSYVRLRKRNLNEGTGRTEDMYLGLSELWKGSVKVDVTREEAV